MSKLILCFSFQVLQGHLCSGRQLPLFRGMFISAPPEQGRPMLQTLFADKLLHAELSRCSLAIGLRSFMFNHKPLLA